ncbi:MAG: FtsX-like permease family protein [Gammaproteobacteria bacterium]|nr:FtsX-like permease family protein [Gammaproteobacteria bacterium]
MLNSFPVFVGLRYSLTRKNNLLLSFVSLISMLGISLGVLILIVALSVINGSILTLRGEALKSVPHATLTGPDITSDWLAVQQHVEAHPEVVAVAPYLESEATIRHQGKFSFVRVRGISPELEANVSNNDNSYFDELLTKLEQTENGIILGTRLGSELDIYSDSEVTLLGLDSLLRRQESNALGFEVVGFADFGLYGNNNTALINLPQAKIIYARAPGTEIALRVKVSDIDRAGEIANAALSGLNGAADLEVAPWYQVQASLFSALTMEKMLTSFMLLMIVVIGAVNIISTLVMVVSDKSPDIAILRTMGASRRTIMGIFMAQGLVVGMLGILLGGAGGILLAFNITELSLLIERLLNTLFTGANIYLLSHLQTRIEFVEVMLVCMAALCISFLATLYPAWRASRIHPAEVLRYE